MSVDKTELVETQVPATSESEVPVASETEVPLVGKAEVNVASGIEVTVATGPVVRRPEASVLNNEQRRRHKLESREEKRAGADKCLGSDTAKPLVFRNKPANDNSAILAEIDKLQRDDRSPYQAQRPLPEFEGARRAPEYLGAPGAPEPRPSRLASPPVTRAKRKAAKPVEPTGVGHKKMTALKAELAIQYGIAEELRIVRDAVKSFDVSSIREVVTGPLPEPAYRKST